MTDHTELIAEARAMDAGVLVTSYDEGPFTNVRDPSIVARLADALEAATTPPTEDEREALTNIALTACESGDAIWVEEAESIADRILAAGFRRQAPQVTRDDLSEKLMEVAWAKFRRMPSSNPSDYVHAIVHALRAEFDITRKAP